MKNSYLMILPAIGLTALAGCADSSTQTTASTRSVTMSSDSKTMTGNTVTQDAPPPADTTTTTTDSSAVGYPAIHSNGQH